MTRKTTKVQVKSEVRIKAYPIIADAVERGATYGVHRAFKHADSPPSQDTIDHIIAQVETNVMSELSEIIDFHDGDGGDKN